MRYPTTLGEIVENGLCIGCGLCQSIAGPNRVQMTMVDPPGRLRPKILKSLDAQTNAAIIGACPGVTINQPLDPVKHADAHVDTIFGPWRHVWRGHAVDEHIRHLGSSGGALTALAIHLLETGKVEFVLHVAASKEQPMRSARHLSFDRTQVMQAAGSRYGPAAPLIDFMELLDKGQRLAIIGKPCDISAVHNLRRHDTRIDQLVAYALAFSCGTFGDLRCSRDMLTRHGIGSEDELTLFRYRGYGCPGATHAETKDGRSVDESYLEFWYGPWGWTHQFRCKICPDPTGEMTDISVADAWPGGRPVTDEWGGWSLFVSRTPRGDALMREAYEAGVVHLEPSEIEAMHECQPHQVVKKQGMVARLAAIDHEHQVGPRFRNVRLIQAARQRDFKFHMRNFAGTRVRIHRGVNRER